MNNIEIDRKKRERWLNRALQAVPKLRKLISHPLSGWSDYVEIIQGYLNLVEKRIQTADLDRMDDKEVQEIKYLCRERYILRYLIDAPKQFISKVENVEKQVKQEEENNAIENRDE